MKTWKPAEIYLPAFKKAVQEGGAWAVMGSYNLYNGQFNCHNKRLLCDILKGEWGFDGVVVSDWGGCRDDAVAAACWEARGGSLFWRAPHCGSRENAYLAGYKN